jgi:hypothetical protein
MGISYVVSFNDMFRVWLLNVYFTLLKTVIYGTEEEGSVHILCECEGLASLMHEYLGSFFLDPEDIRVLVMGASWNFARGTGLLWPDTEYGAQRACLKT